MSRSTIAIALALLAAPAAASAQSGGRPIGCIYDSVPRAVVLASRTQESARAQVAEQARRCTARHGWSEAQGRAAVQYAIGSASYDDAVRALAARGLGPVIIDQVAADLGEARLLSLMSADQDDATADEVGRVILARLEAANYHVPEGDEESERVGAEIGHGMAGKYFRDRGIAAFNAR